MGAAAGLALLTAAAATAGCQQSPHPPFHAVPDGADCVARAQAYHRAHPRPTPSPSPMASADNTSEIVALDRMPALVGGREDLAPDVSIIRSWGSAHPEAFAGVFLANGHVYVGLAMDPAANLAEIRKSVAHRDDIRAVASEYSLTAITAAMAQITNDRAALERRGIHLTSYGPDEYHNRLNVAVLDLTPATVDYLHSHYGGNVVSLTQGEYACAV
jgi:hypothetical protein